MPPPKLSVVIPAKNEREALSSLLPQLLQTLEKLGLAWEVIVVDDGSTDESWKFLREFCAGEPRLRAVRLARSFGQTAALQAGFDRAQGEFIASLDADGQNDPADLPRLIAKLEEGFDAAVGWRKKRADRFLRVFASRIANGLIRKVTGVTLHDQGCTLRAVRAIALKPIRLYGETHRFLPALLAWQGAKVAELEVAHRARSAGKTHYTLGRTFRVLVDLLTVKFLTSYSGRPAHFLGAFAGALFLGGAAAGGLAIADKIFWDRFQPYRLPLLQLASFLGLAGVQVLALGLVAELLTRTYHESSGRPPYLVCEEIIS